MTGHEPTLPITALPPPARGTRPGPPEPPSLDTAPTPREDETTLMSEPPDGVTRAAPPPAHPKRGLAGDVRYTITVTLGVARARRELAAVDAQIAAERDARDETLAAIGADAIADDQIHHPALAKAREELAAIEDERAAHAGTAAGAESEMAAQRRDRERDAARLAAAIAAGETELAKITEQLAPLERDAQAARRRQNEVKETLASIDRRIAAAEASKVAVKKKADPAAIAAEIATLRADRKAVEKDAPAIAAELDALNPRIATLAADRSTVDKRLRDAREADQTAARRADDVCAAIAARKKVEDRAVEEAEARCAKALHALGERLYLDRAKGLGERARRVEERDVAIATAERRALELRDVVASVDRPAVVRGGAVLGAAALLLIVIVWLALR